MGLLGKTIGWDVTTFQLEPGEFSGWFRVASCGSHIVMTIKASHDLVVLGSRRPQSVTFGGIITEDPRRDGDAMAHGFKVGRSTIGGWSTKGDSALTRMPAGLMFATNVPLIETRNIRGGLSDAGAAIVGTEAVQALKASVEQRLQDCDRRGAPESFNEMISCALMQPGVVDATKHRNSVTAERILLEMRAQGNGRVDFKELAERSGMTDKTMRTHCRESFGMTPKSIELAARLEIGRGMLSLPELRIAQRVGPGVQNIAKFLEFSDIRAFSRAYRNQYLISPSMDLSRG